MKEIDAFNLVRTEYLSAKEKFPTFYSDHDGYAIIKEELDELWECVKTKHVNREVLRGEAQQVAAMAIRFLIDLC